MPSRTGRLPTRRARLIVPAVSLAVWIGGAGCGRKDAPAPSGTDAGTTGPQEFLRGIVDSSTKEGEQESPAKAQSRLDQHVEAWSQIAAVGKEIADRTAAATREADLATPEGRREFADEIEAIAQDVERRVPELEAAAQERVRAMVEALERQAAESRKQAEQAS